MNQDRFFGSFVDTEDGEWNICQLRPDYTGNHVITCTPGADYPMDGEPEVPTGRLLMENKEVQQLVQDSNAAAAEGRSLQSTPVIDMMVVWTPKAECKVSDLAAGCSLTATTESNMRGLIDLAFAETNTAFTNSGINAQVRLVHAYRVSYTEASSDAFYTALKNLTDGIGNSNSLRTQYGADAVAMIIDDPALCKCSLLMFDLQCTQRFLYFFDRQNHRWTRVHRTPS